MMNIEIEFIVADLRPLKERGSWFQYQLHLIKQRFGDNSVSNEHLMVYPYVGPWYDRKKTDNSKGVTYFLATNFVRIPFFIDHWIELTCRNSKNKEIKTLIRRRDHVRRFFITDDRSGAINRLKIGFTFSVEKKHGADPQIYAIPKIDILIKQILEMPACMGNETAVKTDVGYKSKLHEVSKFMCQAIGKNVSSAIEMKQIVPMQVIAVVEDQGDVVFQESKNFPFFGMKLYETSYSKIYLYDCDKPNVRIYIIQRKENCTDSYVRQLRSALFFLNSELILLKTTDKNKHLSSVVKNSYIRRWLEVQKNVVCDFGTLIESGILIPTDELSEIIKKLPTSITEVLS